MPKVLFTISYAINPEKREAYLGLVREMIDHLVGTKGKKYGVYEQKGKKNSFTEVFFCDTIEEFDSLEDNQDERTEGLVQRLEEFVQGGKMRYTTLIDVVQQ